MEPSNDSLLGSAKTFRPRAGRAIPRHRLFQRLDEFRQAPVTWITGAPGAGKTTLLSSYLAERGIGGLWLQLDADDADPATFFYYFGLAVEQAAVCDSPVLPVLMPDYLPGLKRFTRRYAETMAVRLARPAAIVLDNYEQLPDQALLHEVLRELAASLPEGVTLLVASRAEPPPAYARLRLYGDLEVLDGQELNLNRDEAFSLAAVRAPQAGDGARIERLLELTQGWLAGFTLLAAEHSDGGPALPQPVAQSRQLLFDYFATELFGRFDARVQEALLRTALLPAMTAADAERLAGDAAAGPMLTQLHRQNCFVVQRGLERPVYEYHALFRSFLLSLAAARIPADDWRVLQRRAAALLAEGGQADAAAGIYRAAESWQELAAVVLREAPALIAAGRHRTLERWLADFPGDLLRQSPWLCYWRAAARLPFDPAAARDMFEQAYAGFQGYGDAAGLYSAWVGAMETFFYEWRDFRPADRWIAEFERLRARHPAFPSRAVELHTYWAMGTLLHRRPQHPMLPAWAERAQLLLDPADRYLSVLLGGYLIIWFLWQGDAARARGVIERISPWLSADVSPMVHILWSCAVGLFHSVKGETAACQHWVVSGLTLAEQTGFHTFDFLLAAQMARCSLVAGDPDAADGWLGKMGGAMRSHSHIDGAFLLHLRCNAAFQHGNWQLALLYARDAMDMAGAAGVPFLEAHCHLDLARLLPCCGKAEEGAGHIRAARQTGQAMGSRVIEYLCLEAEALAAFRRGDGEAGRQHLAAALALSQAMDGAAYQVAGPRANVELYDQALRAGLAVEHVQSLILRHRLVPADPATVAATWPWAVRLYTLGRFDILCDGVPLRSPGKAQRKPLELLKCLCAFGGQAVNQDRVTDALWPDAGGDAADQVLRTTLHRLRKLLGHELAVRLEDRHLHLDPRYVWADCLLFDRAAHQLGAQDKAGLKRALERYRGPFLHGDSAQWVLAFRQRLRTQFMGMAELLGTLLEREGDWHGAADCYVRAIEAEPLAEGFYRRLMAAYVQLGRRPEALDVYQRCRLALLSGLGIGPAQETQSLYLQLAGP